MSARRLVLAVLCAALGVFAAVGGSARAAYTHEYISRMSGFNFPYSIAFNGSGDMYVVDLTGRTVDRFNQSGEPLPFSASEPYVSGSKLTGAPSSVDPSGIFERPDSVAVDDETEDVYVSDEYERVVDVYSSSGEYLFQITGTSEASFSRPEGLWFDQATKELYVAEPGSGAVDVFSSTGVYLSQVAGGGLGPETHNAVTNNLGEVYAGGERSVSVFDSLGILVPPEWAGTETPTGSFASAFVGLDPTNQHVYVAKMEGGVVDEFGASASEQYEGQLTGTPAGPFTKVTAMAVNPVNDDLYVGDGTAIDIFGPDVTIPGTVIETPSGVTDTEITFHGSIDPSGYAVSTCDFEYGTSTSYGHTESCEPDATSLGGGTSLVPVSLKPTALQPNTTYHYRLAATNANSPTPSVTGDRTFTTPGPPRIVSESVTVPPGKGGQTTATLQANVKADQRETTYSYEYGETEAYGSSIPVPAGNILPGESVPPVELTGLKAGATYHYRLVVSNEYGTVDGPDQTLTTVQALILEESASNVASSSVTLEAQIDPLGADTHYYYEYGTVDCTVNPSACTKVPSLSGVDLGAAETTQDAETHLQGLQPETIYHYRVIASNTLGTIEGPDQTFKTQAAGGSLVLPDGRSWEMVSPPQKHGAEIERIFEQDVIQASVDGNAMTYVTTTPTESEPQGYSNEVQVLSTRGPGGWTSRDLATPHEAATGHSVGQGFEYRAFSLDLSQALVEPQGPFTQLSPEATERTVYARKTLGCEIATGCYTPLVSDTNVPAGTKYGGNPSYLQGAVMVAGATPDLSHVVLSSEVPLTSAPGDAGGLYEWAAGQLRLISAGNELYLGRRGDPINAISRDGSRVIWSPGAPSQQLYMYARNTDSEETVLLNRVQPGGVESPTAEVRFQVASISGSTVFFTGDGRLTPNSHAVPAEKFGYAGESDLYVCQMVERAGKLVCDLTDLTPEGNPGESADVMEGTSASEDGSYVYFVAKGVLAPGALAGNPNLYVAHDVAGKWATTLVSSHVGPSDWKVREIELPSLTDRVSPDGHYFAFMGSFSLGGYDTRDAVSGQSDEEVYLYDAVSNKLVCASCSPTGARPVGLQAGETGLGGLRLAGGKVWPAGTWVASNIPGWTPFSLAESFYQSRYLSDSGRLFFNSSDALVPQDVNGNEDVYEYEPPGVGGCTSVSASFSDRSGGCVDLISSGSSPEESAFMDASENGDNVFFLTSAKLLDQDFDASLDIYDARECSAESPCVPQAPVSPPPCTTGDACKAAPSPQPAIYGAPSSQTFSGAGNVVPSTGPVVSQKATSRSRAQMLSEALKACRKKKGRKQRALCEKRAKRAYGSTFKAKKTSRRGK